MVSALPTGSARPTNDLMRCHELEGVRRFDGRAAAYLRARPSYPREAIDFLVERVSRDGVILDVGAGPGIATRLLDPVARLVVAAEPSFEMIATGAPRRGVSSRAEHLSFANGSIDLVVSFNAFHWFKPDQFFAGAHRVLRSGGGLGLAWNDWNLDDAFTAAFVELMRREAVGIPPEDREAEAAPLYETPLFGNVAARSFPYAHALNRELLLLRLRSISYIPASGKGWERVAREAEKLFEQHADHRGQVTHRYFTSTYLADRVGS